MGGDNKPLIGHIDNSGDSTKRLSGESRPSGFHAEAVNLAYGKPEYAKAPERQLQGGVKFDQSTGTLNLSANFEENYQGQVIHLAGIAHDFTLVKNQYGQVIQRNPDERPIEIALPADEIQKQLRAHGGHFHLKAYMKQQDGTVVPYEAEVRQGPNGTFTMDHQKVYDAKHKTWVKFDVTGEA